MAPIRRYLRITRHSALEIRIYLDNPSIAQSWLLNSRDPILPKVIDAIRPLVLPKLREENENRKRKGGKKKKGVRDVVVQDDFEVSIFLIETSTQHALLTKEKTFAEKPRLKSNASKLVRNDNDFPIHVEDDAAPEVLVEDEDEEVSLDQIPEARISRNKRGRDEDSIFVNSDDEDNVNNNDDEDEIDDNLEALQPPSKRKKVMDAAQASTDDKKKMAMRTSYEGFGIYGKILCLIVKRRGGVKKSTAEGVTSGSQMLQNWVSTQAQNEGGMNDGDDG